MNGIYIPRGIIDIEIGYSKKALLSTIIDNSINSKCDMTNKQLGSILNLSTQSISKSINELEKEGYLTIDNSKSFRNRGRVLRVDKQVSIYKSVNKSISKSGESKDDEVLYRFDESLQYNQDEDFDLPIDMYWQDLPSKYKDKLEQYIIQETIRLENIIIQHGGDKKILSFKEFSNSLQAKRKYPYSNFMSAWRIWNGKRK